VGSEYSTEGDAENQDGESEDDLKKSMEVGATQVSSSKNSNPNAKLQDFVIKKMIGRGTFGKVYIVEYNQEPGKFYAMKCIRKDLVLEN